MAMMNYPEDSRHIAISLQNPQHKESFDAMLAQSKGVKLPINNVMIDAGDIRITDIMFHFPYALVIFHLAKDAKVETMPAVEPETVKGPKSPESAPTAPVGEEGMTHEEKDKRVKAVMKGETAKKVTAKPGPEEENK